uniref:SET domain-containing protein n=1 Tax=Rhabditophanes sp. KR3021 TaxID=114890 RepID=A0AC35TIZ7_9BILA
MANHEELIQNFTQWTKENGVVWGNYVLRYDGPESGYGLFATKCSRMNEDIIDIPDSLLITGAKIASMRKYEGIAKRVKLTPLEMLILFFAYEPTDQKTKFKPYFDILPKKFYTPVLDMPDLVPEHLPNEMKAFLIGQKAELALVVEKFSQIEELKNLDRARINWAWQLVNTRCIYVENEPNCLLDNTDGDTIAVIPLVDMLNHDSNAACLGHHYKSIHRYRVSTASTSVREGNQIFVCYGGHENCRLWLEYGFKLADNIHNRIKVSHELLFSLLARFKLVPTSGMKKAILEANYPFTIFSSDSEPTFSMRANIRFLLLEDIELQNWKKSFYVISEERIAVMEKKENEIIRKVLILLGTTMNSKKQSVAEEVKWIWEEYASVVDEYVKNWDNKLSEQEVDE